MLTLEEKLIFEFNIMLLCIIILIQFLYRPKFKFEPTQAVPTSATGKALVYDPNSNLAVGVNVIMTEANGNTITQQTDENGETVFTSTVEGAGTITVPDYGYSQAVTVQLGVPFDVQFGVPRVLSLGLKNRVNLRDFKYGFHFYPIRPQFRFVFLSHN